MNKFKIFVLIFYATGISTSYTQEALHCPNPIIFVHGWNGSGSSFDDIYNNSTFKEIFGDSEQLSFDLNYSESTCYNEDVYRLYYPDAIKNKCLYRINFEISEDLEQTRYWSPSNQSSAYKQGYALGLAIKDVLTKTKHDKVILVAHSMGGIACREYLQRTHSNVVDHGCNPYIICQGNPTEVNGWWFDPCDSQSGHRVAKLLTITTPHLGANIGNQVCNSLSELVEKYRSYDVDSEAVRDLRYSYDAWPGYECYGDTDWSTFLLDQSVLNQTAGIYLYGGVEHIEDISSNENYYNLDYDCNAQTNTIIGINNRGDQVAGEEIWEGTFDNPSMSLPPNIKYTYGVVNSFLTFNGDGIVKKDRQWLYRHNGSFDEPMPFREQVYFLSDVITFPNVFHTNSLNQINEVLSGVDEADYPYFAHTIEHNKRYFGIVQERADVVPSNSEHTGSGDNRIDCDWFSINLPDETSGIRLDYNHNSAAIPSRVDIFENIPGSLKFTSVGNSPVSNSSSSSGTFSYSIYHSTTECWNNDKIYIRICHDLNSASGINTAESWKYPYDFKLNCTKYCNSCNSAFHSTYKKSLQPPSNVQYNIISCNSTTYSIDVNFDGSSSTTYSLNACDQNNNCTYSMSNVTPNQSGTNIISNIPINSTLSIAVQDNNAATCSEGSTLIANSQNCIQQPSSLTHSCTINPSTASPNQQVSVTGIATYDNGNPMINGSVSITYAGNTTNTITNINGQYSTTISASNSTGTISVLLNDGTFTNTCANTLTIQNPNNPGPGFQLTEHWLTPEINNNLPTSEQFHWEIADHELFSWVRLINVTQNSTLQWRFYRPDGSLHFSDNITVPSQNGGTYFAWMQMYTDITVAYNNPGEWSVEVWGKVGNGNWNYLLAENFWIGYEMNRYETCESINYDENGAPIPVNQSNTFYCNNPEINHWFQLTNITEEIDVKVDWIEPNGSVFYSGTSQVVPHPATQNYDWWDYWNIFYGMPVNNQPAANRTGDWKIKVYTRYPGKSWVLQYTDNFQILEFPNTNPVASVVINHSNPVEGDNLTISFSAIDNKYLEKTIRYHRINNENWQATTQNNINENNWSRSVNIGELLSGDKLEYYTVAFDNSGNSHTSNLGSVIIQDDDLIPPVINNLSVNEYNGNGDGDIDDTEQYQICASISDDSGVGPVIFFIDGNPINLNSNYCAIVGPSSSGNHVFQIEATDSDNTPLTSYNSLIYLIHDSCPADLFISNSIDGIYESSNNITTTGVVQINNSQNIIYRSQSINLKPGMHSKPGSVFRAHVNPCNN